jgi:hypothetical protein
VLSATSRRRNTKTSSWHARLGSPVPRGFKVRTERRSG